FCDFFCHNFKSTGRTFFFPNGSFCFQGISFPDLPVPFLCFSFFTDKLQQAVPPPQNEQGNLSHPSDGMDRTLYFYVRSFFHGLYCRSRTGRILCHTSYLFHPIHTPVFSIAVIALKKGALTAHIPVRTPLFFHILLFFYDLHSCQERLV